MGRKSRTKKERKAQGLGINALCACGSGKKSKKCCRNVPIVDNGGVPEEVIKYFQEKEMERELMRNKGIYINYVKPCEFKGDKVWALGNRIYTSRPVQETFHDFIIYILSELMGREWGLVEKEKKEDNQHFLMKCFSQHLVLRNRVLEEKKSEIGDKVYAVCPDGWNKVLLALAFDVCSLMHRNKLPDHMVNRLRNKNEYQGVRYEIAIAAIFSRLDFDIEFLDTQENRSISHCEFIARHRHNGLEIAIESKSRHRSGVINQEGNFDENMALRGNIDKLFEKAISQNPGDRPFLIFIDLNLPITPYIKMSDKQWFREIQEKIGARGCSADKPEPFSGVFFTNYSYHYQAEEEFQQGECLSVIPLFSKYALPEDFLSILINALNNYGFVPEISLYD